MNILPRIVLPVNDAVSTRAVVPWSTDPDEEALAVLIPTLRVSDCNHQTTMCLNCVTTWALDYDVCPNIAEPMPVMWPN